MGGAAILRSYLSSLHRYLSCLLRLADGNCIQCERHAAGSACAHA
jgi:hypothetical protein